MGDFPGEGQPADSSSLVSSVVRDRIDALYQNDTKSLRPRQQTPSPNMTLFVEADQGRAYVDGNNPLNFAGGSSPAFATPVTPNKRIDLLCIDKDGILSIVQGTAAGTPVAPAYPSNIMVLAEVYVRSTSTSIKNLDDGTNGYIFKRRQPLLSLGGRAPAAATFAVSLGTGNLSNRFQSWGVISNTINQIIVRVEVRELSNSGTKGAGDILSFVRQEYTVTHNIGRVQLPAPVMVITSESTAGATGTLQVNYQ